MNQTRGAEANGRGQRQWDAVCRDLQRDIISGRYRPRERLIEDEVIAATGATRHAVRRAFDELARLGLVVRQPNRGVQVRDYTREEIEDLYEIRECLEVTAAERYPLPAPAELLGSLADIAARHEAASREQRFAELFALNNQFHEMLYRAAGNRQLAEAIRHYTFATHPIRTRAFPNEDLRAVAVRDHWQMIASIREGDRAGLAATIREHIRRPKDYYLATNFVAGPF
ncbi:MAG TPA: GntR family transcriptional regulator [Paracoccaceae bacterium]|nr:GntR family transcriptional regulator [Paracoccaceae bacterium]